MENHTSHGQLPIPVLLQESYRCILVVIHDQPLSSSDREKGEHMTARECRNICLFGIDQVRIPKESGCCGRTDSNPTLKLPSVIAGEGPILEFGRAPFPFHCRVMLRHVSIPLISGEIALSLLQGRFRLGARKGDLVKRDDKDEARDRQRTPRPSVVSRKYAYLGAPPCR